MSEFSIPNYELTRHNFLDVVRNRIYKTNFSKEVGGGFCWSNPNKGFDEQGRVKFFVSLNGNDPLSVQARSIAHESIHINIRETINKMVVWGTFNEMRADEEKFVEKQTSIFMEKYKRTAEGAVNYLKIKNGYGFQIPLKLE